MDARPFRPARAVPGLGNENMPPTANTKQTIHQRHKSTGNLLNMPANGSLKVAAKRTALADFSNTAKAALTAADKSAAGAKKLASSSISMLRDHANSSNPLKHNDCQPLQQPAQRPASSRAATATSSSSFATLKPLANEPQKPSQHQQHRGPTRNRNVIFRDASQPEQAAQTFKPESVAAPASHAPVARSSASNSELHVDLVPRQPRHHQSQPVLKTTTQPILKPKLSRASFQRLTFENVRPLDLYLPDEDVTEAPYLDAVEELPKDNVGPVPEEDEAFIPSVTLPNAVESGKISSHPEPKMVDFIPTHQDIHDLAPVYDQQELSDFDEEDYFDDQGYTTAHSYRSRGDNTTTGATTIVLPPKLTKKGEAEIEAARAHVEMGRTEEEIEEEAWDVSMVAEYGDDIFAYMRELEASMLPNAHYMDIQTEIQWSMRSVLMDWVIQVHTRFGLLPETLFLTVNYIDRFLSCKIVSLGKLQLVGATAIFVAAKYEEINCPSVTEIVYMVDGGYSPDEILKAERFMLSMLNFELGWPGPMSFLRRISKADDYDLESRTLSKYLLEVTIMDERFVASPPSYIAAGAHCLSRLLLNKGEWTPAHTFYSGYTYAQLKPLVSMILDCCRDARKHHAAVFEKYADKRYKRVAGYVEDRVRMGFALPFQQSLGYHTRYEFSPEPSLVGFSTSQAVRMPIPIEG